jgi:hypothetical protein
MADPRAPSAATSAGIPLARLAEAARAHRRPVEQWNPPHCGHSGIAIDAAGRWYHEGALIERDALVRLFASVLRREPDGSFVLVTPAEKLTIDVADAPFIATAMTTDGAGPERNIAFVLNSGDTVVAGADCPIRVHHRMDGTPRPYVHVRGTPGRGLEALIARPVFYDLAELALAECGSAPRVGLWSGGCFFDLAD